MEVKHHIKMNEYKQAEKLARKRITHIFDIADLVYKLVQKDEVYGHKAKGRFMYTVHSNAVLIELKKLKPNEEDVLEAVRQKQLRDFYAS